MTRPRRRVACRTCGDPTWTYDQDRISAECRACTYRRQLAADSCDEEEARWGEDAGDRGLYDEDQFIDLLRADVTGQ